ncbi:MAG: hypothetical protein U0R51_06655 [Solirubrobacterales bacterium]
MSGGGSRRGRLLIGIAVVASFFALNGRALATPGDLDPTFGENGVQRVNLKDAPHYSTVGSLIGAQPSGSPVLAGVVRYQYIAHSFMETNVTFAAAGLNDDGTLDPAFGTGGFVIGGLGLAEEIDPYRSVPSAALARDGSIVVAGIGPDHKSFSVARLSPDGTPDPSFSGDGMASFAIAGTNRFPSDPHVAVLSDGSVILAGIDHAGTGSDEKLLLVKFGTDGTLDQSFGTDGVIATPSERSRAVNDLVVDPQDRILISNGIARGLLEGHSESISEVTRLMPDGQPDASFGTGGTLQVVKPIDGFPYPESPRLVVDGSRHIYEFTNGSLTRLNEDGSTDSSFGVDGVVDLSDRGISSVYPDPSGGLFVAGAGWGPISALVVGHLLDDGSVDADFGDDGWSITYHDGSLWQPSMLLRPPNRLLVAAGGKSELIARLRLDDGDSSDRDADGVEGASDRCPGRSGSSRSGCPAYPTSVEITRWSAGNKPGRLAGAVVSVSADNRCLDEREIRLYERRGRELVEAAELSYPAYDAIGERTTEVFIRTGRTLRGHVFAVARGLRKPWLGVCSNGRSASYRIPGSG